VCANAVKHPFDEQSGHGNGEQDDGQAFGTPSCTVLAPLETHEPKRSSKPMLRATETREAWQPFLGHNWNTQNLVADYNVGAGLWPYTCLVDRKGGLVALPVNLTVSSNATGKLAAFRSACILFG
jgi:hypothetical protein